VGKYLASYPGLTLTAGRAERGCNHYRNDPEAEAGPGPEAEEVPPPREELTEGAKREVAKAIGVPPPQPLEQPTPTAEEEAMHEQMQARIREIEGCTHPEGLMYQGPVMHCPVCHYAEDYEDPLLDSEGKPMNAIRELAKEYTPGALRKMNNAEATQAYLGYMMSALCRDNATEAGHRAALRDTLLARGCAEVLIGKARNVEKVLKMTRRGRPSDRRNKK